MRIASSRAARPVVLKSLVFAGLALTVAGCSGGSDRFNTAAYNGSGAAAPQPSVAIPNPGGAPQTYAQAGQGPVQSRTVYNAPAPQPQYAYNTQQPYSDQIHTGSVAPVTTTQTGNRITVQYGDTAYSLSRRHNVSIASLLSANGMSDPSQLKAGQTLVIPGGAATASRPAPVAPPSAPAQARSHTVASGDTVFSLGRRYGVTPDAIIRANALASPNAIKVGQRLSIPGGTTASTAPAPTRSVQTAPVQVPSTAAVPPAPATAATPTAYIPPRQPAVAPRPAGDAAPVAIPQPQASTEAGKFRWPARGRVISGFGRKANGAHNDGINISLPAGTPIRAAEDGVVAYAGNELKGYGNLILIRHANDFVTAYAHTETIDVKRGDKVERGQIIGTVGQTGSVTAPQLHFEVRQGSRPVDPMAHLAEI